MSKASRQSLALLAVACGALKVMESEKFFVPRRTIAAVSELRVDLEQVVKVYPASGDGPEVVEWMMTKLGPWQEELDRMVAAWSPITLITMTEQLLVDLSAVTRNKKKASLLAPVEQKAIEVSKMFDDRGDYPESYVEANRLLEDLYKRLEFRIK